MKKSVRHCARLNLRRKEQELIDGVKKARQAAEDRIDRYGEDDLNFDMVFDIELARVRAMTQSKTPRFADEPVTVARRDSGTGYAIPRPSDEKIQGGCGASLLIHPTEECI
uniref:Uncharacterized protein n=1 Tax=Candidatus Kentrum sp. LPFa TaxID=2126335 RepID=A0A450Y0Z9_9GAMM|nr:MAG: hypothetical protein BECKLPF1236A_GA0070988_103114 [Candidatus Kentron sp. LPFa]VFK35205.1 MAG: hypothetical protein BECKLPF1236C_GA0070990_103443 [Candidatus Kentron sp. LPFa]